MIKARGQAGRRQATRHHRTGRGEHDPTHGEGTDPVQPRRPTRLQILHTPYTIKALRGDKLAAQAVLTGFDTWHVPLRRRPVLRRDQLGLRHRTNRDEVAWRALDTRAEALALVTLLAVGGTP